MGMGGAERQTFFSLSFSVFSSLLALAACLLSCFAVNCARELAGVRLCLRRPLSQWLGGRRGRGPRRAIRTYLQIEERFLETGHDGRFV